MSSTTGIRSFGRPYFALEQADLNDMIKSLLPDDCFGQFKVQFRLNALPVQYASGDECHALVSFMQFQNGIDLFQVGITPNGAIRVEGYGGAYIMTYPAAVLPDNQWHNLWVTLAPDHFEPTDHTSAVTGYSGFIILDGVSMPLPYADLTGGLVEFSPVGATDLGEFLIFNNAKGMSRTDVTIRRVEAISANTGTSVVWSFSEGFGDMVSAVGTNFAGAQVFDAQAKFRTPYFNPLLWGAVPEDGINSAYTWKMLNTYYEIGRPTTNYLEAGGTP